MSCWLETGWGMTFVVILESTLHINLSLTCILFWSIRSSAQLPLNQGPRPPIPTMNLDRPLIYKLQTRPVPKKCNISKRKTYDTRMFGTGMAVNAWLSIAIPVVVKLGWVRTDGKTERTLSCIRCLVDADQPICKFEHIISSIAFVQYWFPKSVRWNHTSEKWW